MPSLKNGFLGAHGQLEVKLPTTTRLRPGRTLVRALQAAVATTVTEGTAFWRESL